MAMTMTTTTNGWLTDGLGTQAGATVCALLPSGLLTGALWQQTGPGPAAALALAFLALAALLLKTVRRLAAA
jgi:hypothetical protein